MSMEVKVFRIEGLSPLLMNNPASMKGGSAELATSNKPAPEDEARAKVYAFDNGHLYLPSHMFRSSIIGRGGGASGRKIGKFTANSRVQAGVFVIEPYTPLLHPKTGKPITEYRINVMRAVVQGNGVQRARPEIPEWSCLVPFEIDTDFITIDQVIELLNISGKVAGVGDYRPNKKGPYGRYKAALN